MLQERFLALLCERCNLIKDDRIPELVLEAFEQLDGHLRFLDPVTQAHPMQVQANTRKGG